MSATTNILLVVTLILMASCDKQASNNSQEPIDDYALAYAKLKQHHLSPKQMNIFWNYTQLKGYKAIAFSTLGAIGISLVTPDDITADDIREHIGDEKYEDFVYHFSYGAIKECAQHLKDGDPPCRILMFNDQYVYDEQ